MIANAQIVGRMALLWYRSEPWLAAQILKSRNPNSFVRLKDLKTGEETVVAFKAAQ